jgi:hypothetical protein
METTDRRGRTLLNRLDKFVDYARETSSRGAAFIYAILGVLAQVAHNALLAYDVSLFENNILRILQAVVIAMAISFALLYFVLTADNKDHKTFRIVWVFYTLEVFLNIVYYMKKIVFDVLFAQVQVQGSWSNLNWSEPNWFMLLIGLPFAIFIPFIIKSYAGTIDAHKPALALDDDDFVKAKSMSEQINIILEPLQAEINALKQSLLEPTKALTDEDVRQIIHSTIQELPEQQSIDINVVKAAIAHDLTIEFTERINQFESQQIDIDALKSELFGSVKLTIDKSLENVVTTDDLKSKLPNINVTDIQESLATYRQKLEQSENLLQRKTKELSDKLTQIENNMIKNGAKVKLTAGEKSQEVTLSAS